MTDLIKIRQDDFNGVKYYQDKDDINSNSPFIVVRPTVKLTVTNNGIFDLAGRMLDIKNNEKDKELFETFKADFGFICGCYKLDSKHLEVDGANLSSDDYINHIAFHPETLVALIRTDKNILEYCMVTNLTKPEEHIILGYDHYRSVHGIVRSRDYNLNKTVFYYRKVRKFNVLKLIIEEYFYKSEKEYEKGLRKSDILTIDADVPEFLRDRRITKQTDKQKTENRFKKLPLHNLLVEAGFTNPYKPKQEYAMKNGKPIGVFNYQVRKRWFAEKVVLNEHIRRK